MFKAPTTETPLCQKCGYVLAELPAGRCPECGRAFDPDDRSIWRPRLRYGYRLLAITQLSVIAAFGLQLSTPSWGMWLVAHYGLQVLVPTVIGVLTVSIAAFAMLIYFAFRLLRAFAAIRWADRIGGGLSLLISFGMLAFLLDSLVDVILEELV
jgi:hypothetical protein